MSILPEMKQLIIMTSLVLAWPLGAFAGSPPAAGSDPAADRPAHEHEMPGCRMAGGFDLGDGMDREEMAGADGWVPPPLRMLQLSEAQEDKVFAIMHAEAPQARDLGKAVRNAHRGLHELATSAKYDEAKAKGLADSLGKALSEAALLRARTHHQIYEVLTPEQRDALEGHAKHGGEHGPRHHEEHAPAPAK